ncbi:nucleotide modification associated domain-containing protein [bacterium]|nr:nucleotide modification associated domain-containing protein [bacterium]
MTRNKDTKTQFDSEKWTSDPHAGSNINEYNAQSIMKIEYPTIYNGYLQIMDEQFELFCKKHLDYGMGNISQGTNLDTEDEKKFALSGLFFRMNDKINRWKNLIISNRKANNETLIDTYQDLTNYGIISQLVERDMWRK